MSIAGIRSNRGDAYQTLLAFDWALTVLSDKSFSWLEIDSISYPVDDVVIGKADGSVIACQCKKNQVDFKNWTIADLGDELDKAASLLNSNTEAEIRFYSRSNFGLLAKLKEHCSTQNENSYEGSLGKELKATDTALSKKLVTSSPGLSTYEFLRRTQFVASEELDRMETLLRERLRSLVSNPDIAFNALWFHLDQLGGRIGNNDKNSATKHRYTKQDLNNILNKSGAMLVPPMNLADIRKSFSATSAIGRVWRRDIAGQRIQNLVMNEITAAIDTKKRSILLMGQPGAGKTCVMLALQDELEARALVRSDIVPLFIQSREFADLVTSQDRQAQGLSEEWVEKVARLAEDCHVVISIDSLDVLSIARDHLVLKYFLAQIDRLLLIPNVTVVTACRTFDRHYDRRIAERQWDCELECKPLDWDIEVAPLLSSFSITTTTIDAVTRELIRNPRELALYIEMVRRQGIFNVVTSQALAQRYLDTIVLANSKLGDAAIQAIEAIASEMLKLRSLAVPRQRFSASDMILRELLSLNVLQETQDGKLTFGHQTLLDVLVISGALRNGITLNTFIQSLPPVPFVRPSIKSFVTQLALGERSELRKQLRTVLKGKAAFHIRRLVAETIAELPPQDGDWPLILDLQKNNRDIFQVIYTLAKSIEWHQFWLKNLIPVLKNAQDAEGLLRHAHLISRWSNEDCAVVVSFWLDILTLSWIDNTQIADRIGNYLSSIKAENLEQVAPLLERLINLPIPKHSSLGRTIACCVKAGYADDLFLWRYITKDLSDEDFLEYRFDDNLRCQAHEFRDNNDNFICHQMEQSVNLLDLAVESVERWSEIRVSRYGKTRIGYRNGFLSDTSYEITHSERDLRFSSSMKVLLSAIESSILKHAETNSDWWQANRERLCFNLEGALLYFAVLACTEFPENNINVIGKMLCNRKLLEFDLTYELGALLRSAFRLLNTSTQDAVMTTILTVWEENAIDSSNYFWILKTQAELVSAIPCYLRTPEAQAVVDTFEKNEGVLVHQPDIRSHGGTVRAPFSFEVFLSSSNSGVISLLAHYVGYSDRFRTGAEFLIGGEREVGWQLREAASRHPIRFLKILSVYWLDISARFRDEIMSGIATHLDCRYGNRQRNDSWQPLEEPEAQILVNLILDELEKHQIHWRYKRSAAEVLEACANVVKDPKEAERLVFLAVGFSGFRENEPSPGENVNLLDLGINMTKGDVAEALMILATTFADESREFPDLLLPTLSRFASDEHPAIRALILRRLPYLQSKKFEVGWSLFGLAMQDAKGLWQIAEPCLYYAYHTHFETVGPILTRLYCEGYGQELETWGRISALAAMDQCIDFEIFLKEIKTLNNDAAWLGAAKVWTHVSNLQNYRDQCLIGIEAGLEIGGTCAEAVANQMEEIFRESTAAIVVPFMLIQRVFSAFGRNSQNKDNRLFGFHEWLNAISQFDPEYAMAVTEIYLQYVRNSKPYLYDHENNLTQLLTRLFSEAEEREEFDDGEMLCRVVAIQDELLSIGVDGVLDWLKAAERP